MSTEDVAGWLRNYAPRKLESATWRIVRGFVIDTVLMTKPASIESAARIARVVMRLAVWCLSEGMSLDREHVFDPAVIERFIAVSEENSPSRATDRWQLRRVGPLVTTDAPWEPHAAAVARRNVAPPYSADEIGQLRRDSAHQPGPLGRQAARALLVAWCRGGS